MNTNEATTKSAEEKRFKTVMTACCKLGNLTRGSPAILYSGDQDPLAIVCDAKDKIASLEAQILKMTNLIEVIEAGVDPKLRDYLESEIESNLKSYERSKQVLRNAYMTV